MLIRTKTRVKKMIEMPILIMYDAIVFKACFLLASSAGWVSGGTTIARQYRGEGAIVVPDCWRSQERAWVNVEGQKCQF